MKKHSWDETVFGGIVAVNRNLYQTGLPEGASRLLQGMQDCLCSGDGLSTETAFRVKEPGVEERVLWVLGLAGAVTARREEGGLSVISLSDNPHGIGSLFFRHLQQ